MADREDFATAVGEAIKAHVPDRAANDTGTIRLDSVGQLQHLVGGSVVTEFNSSGELTRGRVQRIERGDWQVRFDPVGRLQYYNSSTGQIAFQFSPNGQLTLGTIPWERITGAPPIPAPTEGGPVHMPGPLGPLFARLAHADTVTVPILFVGSSTTRRDYPKNVVSRIAATYPSGGVEYGTVYADTPLGSKHTGPGVAGYNAGRGGRISADYVDTPILGNAALVQPVAIFHGIGSNDWANNVPPSTFETNVRAAIAALDAQIAVPHVHVLMQQHTRAGSRTYAWGDYTAALRRIAEDTRDRVFVDLGPAIDRTSPLGADPFGYGDGDGTHLNAAGEEALAELMAHALGVPGSQDPRAEAALYSSGPRRLTTLANGWTGDVRIERDGRRIELVINGVHGQDATSDTVFDLPPGFTPTARNGTLRGALHWANSSGETAMYRYYLASNRIRITGGQGNNRTLYGEPLWFLTNDPPPATPPWQPA